MDRLITYGAWRMAHRPLAHGATDRATVLESVHGENDVTSHAPGNDFNGGCIAK